MAFSAVSCVRLNQFCLFTALKSFLFQVSLIFLSFYAMKFHTGGTGKHCSGEMDLGGSVSSARLAAPELYLVSHLCEKFDSRCYGLLN